MDADQAAVIVDAAILSRRSVRAFLPTPVPRATIEALLTVAGRAPSGSNIQPWRVDVLTGEALAAFTADLLARVAAGEPEAPEYLYYPIEWRAPYLDRRRAAGWGLFALAGVARGDREGSARQRARNYTFFDAPAGLIFSIDADLQQGSWLDYGMFLQNIMIAARARGLDTCPQAAFANYPAAIRARLGIPADRLVMCGMALGHADPDAPVNRLVTGREPATAFTTFHA